MNCSCDATRAKAPVKLVHIFEGVSSSSFLPAAVAVYEGFLSAKQWKHLAIAALPDSSLKILHHCGKQEFLGTFLPVLIELLAVTPTKRVVYLETIQSDAVRTIMALVESENIGLPDTVRFVLPRVLQKWQTKSNSTRHLPATLQEALLTPDGTLSLGKVLQDVQLPRKYSATYPPLSALSVALVGLLKHCPPRMVQRKVLPAVLSQLDKVEGLRLVDLLAVVQAAVKEVPAKGLLDHIMNSNLFTLMSTLTFDDPDVPGLAHVYLAQLIAMCCKRIGVELIPNEMFSSLAILLQKLVQTQQDQGSPALRGSVKGTVIKAFFFPLSVLLGSEILDRISMQSLPQVLADFLVSAPIDILQEESKHVETSPREAVDEVDEGMGATWRGYLTRSFSAHRSGIATLEVDPEERYLITSSKGGTVKLWDVSTALVPRELAHVASTATAFPSKTVNAVRIVDNGQRAVLLDGAMRIWDIGSEKTQAVSVGRTCKAMVAMEAMGGGVVDGDCRGNVLWVASAYGAVGRVDLRLPVPLVATHGLPGGYWADSPMPMASCSLTICGNKSVGLVCVGRASGQISVRVCPGRMVCLLRVYYRFSILVMG